MREPWVVPDCCLSSALGKKYIFCKYSCLFLPRRSRHWLLLARETSLLALSTQSHSLCHRVAWSAVPCPTPKHTRDQRHAHSGHAIIDSLKPLNTPMVSWLGKLVLVFWWVELDFFSLECNEVSSSEFWDISGLGVTLGSLYIEGAYKLNLHLWNTGVDHGHCISLLWLLKQIAANITGIYPFMVLEDRSQGIGRITLPLKVLGKIFHCLYQLFVGPWPHHSNLCLCLQVAFSPCLFMSFSLDLGPTLNQHEFTLHGCVLSGFCFVRLFGTLWTVFREATQSMGFSRQEYWSRLLCPPPGGILNPGVKPPSLTSPALAGRFFNTNATWEKPRLDIQVT